MAKKKIVEASRGPEQFREVLSQTAYEQLIRELASPLAPGLRANTLKISPKDAASRWSEWYGWDMRPVPFCASGWVLESARDRPSQTSEFKMGFFYLQDAASMLPAELFSLDTGDELLILDLAAAPGGKSTHLSARSRDRGLLVANDSSFGRIPALRTALLDWGASNAIVTNQPGEKFGRWFPETFDRVLLDAPCSMENLRPSSGHASRPVSAHERHGLSGRQLSLLASAVEALKPGGEVVYSTCTLAPEEDEGVIDKILQMYGSVLRLDRVLEGAGFEAPGLPSFEGRPYTNEMDRTVRLWPHILRTSGFFAARLTKTGSTTKHAESPPARTFSRLGLEELNRHSRAAAVDRIRQGYGFDLQSLLDEQHLTLWRLGNTTLALPEAYMRYFSSFPVSQPGFPLFDDTHDGLILSHEMVARFGLGFQHGKYVLAPEDRPAWLRGSDLPPQDLADYPVNSIVVVVDDKNRLLGRGKILRDRLKNMLPRRLALP